MRALISVSNKDGLIDFARGLDRRGCEIISTGGTARVLSDAGIRTIAVAEVTGFPEMLGGRVKTLHPNIHGGILARRHVPADLAALARHGIAPIDLVVVNLYPFVEASKRGLRLEDLLEEIDIGGPALVRAAAKNFRDVLIVVSPADYDAVLRAIDDPRGPSPAFRFQLAQKAFAHTAAYDSCIAATLPRYADQPPEALPATIDLRLHKIRDLRYGENPHQRAAWYGTGADQDWEVLQGKELSFTNLLDLDAALRIVGEFPEPAAVVIKHTNPCGAASAATLAAAYVRARDADSLSAFGGIVGLNRVLDEETARAIVSTFIEAVVAPDVDEAARALLRTRPSLRVVRVPAVGERPAARQGVTSVDQTGVEERPHEPARRELRSIAGGVLVQEHDVVAEAADPWPNGNVRVVTKRQPTAEEWEALRFAWRIAAHIRSNAVIFAGKDVTLAIGAGQMSRVDAVNVAVLKAGGPGGRLAGSVAASDAFLPFRDGLDAIAAAGATAVVQPGGSVRDQDVIAAADEHGLAMVFTGRRHFRH